MTLTRQKGGSLKMASTKKPTFSKSTKVNSPWLNNAMKSIGLSVGDYVKNVYPNLSDAASSATSGTKNMVKTLRQSKNTNARITEALQQNKYVQLANKAFKNALSDLKTGNLNNADREGDIFGADFGFDDFGDDEGFSFGDDDTSPESTNVNQVQYIDTGSRDAVMNLSRSVDKQTESMAKTGKATMDAQIAVSATMLHQMQQMSSEISSHLSNINNSLQSIVEFNNTTMTKFVEASMAAYSSMGSKKNDDASFENGPMTGASTLNVNGGLNLAEYKKYAKQQIKRAFSRSDAGMLAAFVDDTFLEGLAANPIGAMTNGVVSWMMPKIVGTTIEGMEKSFQNFLPAMLNKVASLASNSGNSIGDRIVSFIGEAFGIKSGTKKSIEMAKVEKGPVPFDGETKHAITEIITKELREQTAYLKLIAEHHTDAVTAEKYRSRAKIFDYNANDYIDQKQIAGTIYKAITDATIGQWGDEGGIGESLKELVKAQEGEDNQALMGDLIKEMEFLASSVGQYVEIGNANDSKFQEILTEMREGSDEREIKMIEEIVKHLNENKEKNINAYNQQHTARIKAGQALDDILAEIENNSSYYNLRNSGITAEEMKDMPKSVYKYMRENRKRGSASAPIVINSAEVRGPAQKKGLLSPLLEPMTAHASGFMNSIIAGDTRTAMNEFSRIFTDQVSNISDILKDKVLSPLKVMLLGNKDEDGNSVGGLLSGVKNGMNDIFGHLKYQITGKGWKDSKGNTYEDSETSVVATLKSMGNSVKNGIMEKLFGRKNEETGEREKEGILSKFTDTFKKGLDGWKSAFLGEDVTQMDPKDVSKKISDKLHGYTKDATMGAAIGAGTGMLAGGSILGTLVGGPIGGAALGLAAGILNKGGKFQDWLFGEKDEETGERYGGFLSRETQDYIKKNKGLMIGGGAVGAFTSIIAGKSGGLLGTLVGGPIVGAGLGIATTLVTRSDTFKAFLFGDEEKGQEGLINAIKNGFKRGSGRHAGMPNEEFNVDAKVLGMSGIGVLGGVLASAFLPGGPIFGGLIGLGASIAANGETFKKFLFGEDYTDEDGNKKHRHGIFGRLGNMFNATVLRPLKTQFAHYGKVVAADLKYTIGGTISDAAHLISEKVGDIVGTVREKFTSVMNAAATTFKEQVVAPLADTINKAVFEPIATAVKATTSFVFNTTRALTLAPFKLVSGAISVFRNRLTEWWEGTSVKKFIDSAKDWLKTRIKRTLRSIRNAAIGAIKLAFSPITLAFKGIGAIFGGAARGLSWAYDKIGNRKAGKAVAGPNGDMTFAQRRAYRKKLEQEERATIRREYREQKIRDKNAKLIAKATKGQYSKDTAEARAAARRANPKIKLNTSIDTEDELARKAKAKIEGESVHGRSLESVQKLNFAKLNEQSQMIWILSKILGVMNDKYDYDGKSETLKEMEANEGSQYSNEEKAIATEKIDAMRAKYAARFKGKGLEDEKLNKAIEEAVQDEIANSGDDVLKYINRLSKKMLAEKVNEVKIETANEIEGAGTLADALGFGTKQRINDLKEKRDSLVAKGDKQYKDYLDDAIRKYWRKSKGKTIEGREVDLRTSKDSFLQMVLNDEFARGTKGEEGYMSSIDVLNEMFGGNLKARSYKGFHGSERELSNIDAKITRLKEKSRDSALKAAEKVIQKNYKKQAGDAGFNDITYGNDVSKWSDTQLSEWAALFDEATQTTDDQETLTELYIALMSRADISQPGENASNITAKADEVRAELAQRVANAKAITRHNKKQTKQQEKQRKQELKRLGFAGHKFQSRDGNVIYTKDGNGKWHQTTINGDDAQVDHVTELFNAINTGETNGNRSIGRSAAIGALHGVVNAVGGNNTDGRATLDNDEETTSSPNIFANGGEGYGRRRVTGGGRGPLGLALTGLKLGKKLISKPFKAIKNRRDEKKVQKLNSQQSRKELSMRERLTNSIKEIGENVKTHMIIAKDHAVQWAKTFAKKGLITLGLLALSPILMKVGKGIIGFFKGKWSELKEKGPKAFFADIGSAIVTKLESAPLIGSVVKKLHSGFDFIKEEWTKFTDSPKSYLAQLPNRVISSIENSPVIGPVFTKLHDISENIAEKGLKTWFVDGVEAIKKKYPAIGATMTVMQTAGELTKNMIKAIGPDGLKGIAKGIAAIGTVLGKILGLVGDIINHFGISVGERTNGMSVAEATAETVADEKKAAKEIATGHFIQGTEDWVLGSDGKWDHESGAKVKFLMNAGKSVPAAIKAAPKAAKGLAKIGQGALKTAGYLPGIGGKVSRAAYKASKGGTKLAGKLGTKLANSKLGNASRAIGNVAKSAGGNLKKAAIDKVDNVAAKAGSNISKAMSFIKEFIGKVIAKVSKKGGKKLATDCADDAAKAVEKGLQAGAKDAGFVAKLSSGLAKAASVLQVATIAYGALNGISSGGAAKLFQVDASAVDGGMRIIAGAIGAFTGTGIGSVVDLVNELVESATGVNFLSMLAVNIYHAFAGDKADEKLDNARKEFKEAYDDYKDDKIHKAFYEAVKNDSLPDEIKAIYDSAGEEEAFNAYKKAVSDGDIQVEYDSFADFNAKKNKSLAKKIGGAFKKAGKGIKDGAKNLWDTVKNNKKGTLIGAALGGPLGAVIANTKLGKTIGNKATEIGHKITDWGSDRIGDVVNLGKSIGNKASQIGHSITDWGSDRIGDVVDLYKKARAKDEELWNSFTNTSKKAFTFVKDKIADFTNGIKDKFETFKEGIKSIPTKIKEGLSSIKATIFKGISAIKDKVLDILPIKKITELANVFKEKFLGAAGAFTDKLTSGLTKAKEKVEELVEKAKGLGKKAKGKLKEGWDTVTGFLGFGGNGGGRGDDTVNGFSYYSQNDSRWKNASYSDGVDNATMGDSGCGPAAMSMIASQMTGRSVDPRQMASFAQATGDRDSTGTNWNFINKASSAFGISSRETITPSANYVASELSQGHPMILSGASGGYGVSPYTPAGHYVVATGIDGAGNVNISDPRGKMYSKKYNINDVVNDTGAAWSFGGGYGSSYEGKLGKVEANLNGSAYTSPINNLSRGQCTWYAEGRAYEKYGWKGVQDQPMGNGGEIYANALRKGYAAGTEIKPNSLVSRGGSSSYGHVLYVEDVDRENNKVYYSEANSDGSGHAPDDGVIKVQSLSDWNARNPYGYVYTDGSGNYSDAKGGTSSNSSTGAEANGVKGTQSVLSVISQMISEMGTRALNGIFTGNWRSDYKDFLTNLKNRDAKLAESSDSSTVGSGSSSNKDKSVTFVGDSRIVGMYAAVSSDSSKNGLNTPINAKFGKHRFIGKVGVSDGWLKDQGAQLVKDNIQSNGIIIIWLGVNNLSPDNYTTVIKDQLSGQVSGNKIYYLSVGPCEGSYANLNNSIIEFNNKIKTTLPPDVKFLDIYDYIKNGLDSKKFKTVDGLHYNGETYQAIYTKVLNVLGVNAGGSGRKTVPTRVNNFISKLGGYGRRAIGKLIGGGRGAVDAWNTSDWAGDLKTHKRKIARDKTGNFYNYTSDFFKDGQVYEKIASTPQVEMANKNSEVLDGIKNAIAGKEYDYLVRSSKKSSDSKYKVFTHGNAGDRRRYMFEFPIYDSPTTANKKEVVSRIRKALKGALKNNKDAGTLVKISDFNTGTSGDNSSTTATPTSISESWISVVQGVKQIFAKQLSAAGYNTGNVYSYSTFNFDFGSKGKKAFRRDCTGFVSACLWVAGVVPDEHMPAGGFTSHNFGGSMNNPDLIDDLAAAGFQRMDFPGWDKLVKGDILISHELHGEIYASGNAANNHMSWNCGSGEGLLAMDTAWGADHTYEEIWRPTGSVGGTTTDEGNNSKSVLTVISSMMSEIGTRAINGAFTGKWDSNYDSFLSSLYSSNNGTSSDGSTSSSGAGAVGNSTKEKVWNSLRNNGFSKEAAAGVMGNINQESGFNESVHQSDGGAGGLLQWDPWGDKIGKYAQEQKGDKHAWEKDVGLQMQYLYSDLPAQEWAFKANPSALGAPNVSLDEFKSGKNIKDATIQFEAGYERAGAPMMEKRIKFAQDIYDEFKNYKYNSNTVGPVNQTSTTTASAGDDDFIGPVMGGSGRGHIGPQGGGKSSVSRRRVGRGGRGSRSRRPNQILRVGGYGTGIYDNISSKQYEEIASSYDGIVSGYSMEDLNSLSVLRDIVDILQDIATNTAVSSDKLDMLKNMTNNKSTTIITDGGRGTGKQTQNTSTATRRGNTIPKSTAQSRNTGLATRIAKGV